MIQIAAKPFIISVVQNDWNKACFEITPEEYDVLLLEPIHFPSIRTLSCSSLLTDKGKMRICACFTQVYLEAVESILLGQCFTECGGLLLKRWVSELQEELIRCFGDEGVLCVELRKLQLFSYIVSVPRDVSDVSALCEKASVQLTTEEIDRILALRL